MPTIIAGVFGAVAFVIFVFMHIADNHAEADRARREARTHDLQVACMSSGRNWHNGECIHD